LEVLLDAAGALARVQRQESPPVVVLIAGDGAVRPALEARLREHPLPNLRFLPLLPEADYREMLAASNVCLITQAKGTGRFFLPSKLLTVLAAGRPVVALADETSELASAVHEGGFGVVVPSEDAEGLARTLCSLAASPGELVRYGLNGANWVTRFEADSVLGQFECRVLQDEHPGH
jgi:colanic acid biosynthesis glycosyl transferase WcaI